MSTTDKPTSREALLARVFDPQVLFVSLHEAAAVLGIAKSTAHDAVARTGELCAGIPVQRVGMTRRYIVSTRHLRAAYGADSIDTKDA